MDELNNVLEEIKRKEVDLRIQIVMLQEKVDNLERAFHDCVNELCLQCGQYHEEHNGACDGCRWLKPRKTGGVEE